mmetsp:Transcript_23976/g.38568  ORF Transcript_23976/g.38568 Transcript_23976/m.38568 type:complete len:110 (+) Transcript_23976:201-530(+)|eukprot:CAMPEP_0181363580 /NCGR_PEP_ID=MMETSP1106-20121128/8826_1 /TAXON_ID=81844 /ORGANISM="Mantoniella antarctica, Strain SL-175" /LENGTH=109 /DNA_ID=CAMNT_0023478031 /DNA_START=167 /DNA_END=496 /DNA_ORIENTATION=+
MTEVAGDDAGVKVLDDAVPEEDGEELIRTQLRQRTLEMWLALRNQHVKLHLFSGVEVCGVFQAVDAKHENLVIYNLDSGIGVVPTALVRWSDVLSMTTQGDGDASAGWV